MSFVGARFRRRAFWIFVAGFLIGMALVYVGQERLVGNSQFLNSMQVEKMGAMTIDRRGLFGYSLWQRLWMAGLLCLLAAAGLGGAAAFAFLVWCGICAGTILSVLSLRYGIRGVLLFAGGIFPQMFLLVPAYLILLEWCVVFRRRGRRVKTREAGIPASGGHYDAAFGDGIFYKGRRLAPAFALLGVGCLVEGYVNPVILEQIFRLFW